ncbi:melC2 [Symbiodinium sp. CCMP2456]|nr:melC2 [Symbiodinium sp. CCMP2456]
MRRCLWTARLVSCHTAASPSIFSETYFGSAGGTGSDSQVVDCAFPNWWIRAGFSLSDYNPTGSSPYAGSPMGMLRGPSNNHANAIMTRFGSMTGTSASRVMRLSAGASTEDHMGRWAAARAATAATSRTPVTSPNDPLFMFHHANVGRSMRWWMLKNAAKRSTFYGFPAAHAEGIRENTGSYYLQNLLDVMSSTSGFTTADLGFSDASSGFQTNADLLCHNGPPTSAYTYDTEVACSGGSTACSAVWGDTTDDRGRDDSWRDTGRSHSGRDDDRSRDDRSQDPR